MYKDSMTYIAKRYLTEKNQATFNEIWEVVLPVVKRNLVETGFEKSKLNDALANKQTDLYTILILDKTFILVEKDIWSLRKFFTYEETAYKTGEMHIKSDAFNKKKK